MDKLTITFDGGDAGRAAVAGSRGVRVRPLVTAAGAAVRAAVVAGSYAWLKDGEPWQPLCPMVNRQLPGEFRLSQLFLAGIASLADDKAALKARLERLCGRLGVSPAAMTQPVAELSPLEYHQLICALAILSPNPDIVLLPAASWLSLDEWRELLREFAPCPKTLWPVLPLSTAKGPDAVAISLAWTRMPPAPVGTPPHALRPQGDGLAKPGAATSPAAQTMAGQSRPLPAGLELTTVAELPLELAAQFSDENGETPVLWLKGLADGDERPTYDLSAALQDANGAPAERGWRIAISASADVVWGCLSRRRPQGSAVAGGVIAVAAGVKLRWWQMTTLAVQGNWRWRLAAGANVALTQLAPDFDGRYDVFELAGTGFSSDAGSATGEAAVVATVVEFAKTYHNQPLPPSWQELGAGSRLLRLWQNSAGLCASTQADQRTSGHTPQKLTITNLPFSRPEPGGVPIPAMLAVLTSHGIAEPWDQLLAALAPKLRESLPMEYYVDLLTLLPQD